MANTTIKKTPLSTPVVSTQETNTATTLSVDFFDDAGGAHSLNIPITTGYASSPECYYNNQNDRYSASDMSASEYMVTGYYKNSSNETKYISLTIRDGNVVMPSSYPDSYSGISRKPTVSVYSSNIRKVTYDGSTIYIPLVRQSATVEGFLIEEIDLNNSYFGKVNTDGTYDIYKDNADGTKTVISLSSSGEFTEAYIAEEVEIPSGGGESSSSKKDLGLVTAYGAAKEGGYTGTYEEYKEKLLELLNLNLSTLGNEYDDTELRNLINGKMDKVNLARVATSGNYYDLSDRPTIPSVPSSIVNGVKGNNESSYRTGNVNITPSNLGLATVATSGSYNDLRNKPTIPTGLDWTYYNSAIGNENVYYPSDAKDILVCVAAEGLINISGIRTRYYSESFHIDSFAKKNKTWFFMYRVIEFYVGTYSGSLPRIFEVTVIRIDIETSRRTVSAQAYKYRIDTKDGSLSSTADVPASDVSVHLYYR